MLRSSAHDSNKYLHASNASPGHAASQMCDIVISTGPLWLHCYDEVLGALQGQQSLPLKCRM